MLKPLSLLNNILLLVILKICRIIHSTITICNYLKTPKRCPEINNKLILYSAGTLAEMIRKKEISSEAVIKAYISRIKSVNPIINAVVEDRFISAIKEAREIDTMIANAKLTATLEELATKYPLLGLPITVKESIAVKGSSHAAGRVFPGGKMANKDAHVVKLCREAGAIPLLVSNTPELCINFETYNKVTGTTCNPYDTRRTCGGSSGGEAALLGAGASLIGLGSDLAGSIRLPASFCGIWGHKPTAATVSAEGHYPSCADTEIWERLLLLGPMTRYASDLPLVLNVILKEESRSLLRLNEKVDIKKIKFYHLKNNGNSKIVRNVDNEILLAMKRLMLHLKLHHSNEVIELNMKDFKYAPDFLFCQVINVNNVDNLFENGKGCFSELLRFFAGRSDAVFPSILYGIIKRLSPYVSDSYLKRNNKILQDLRRKLIDTLGKDGILIYPTHTSAANFHGQVYCKISDYGYTSIFNALGFPVTNCPLGLNPEGLPIGIQIIAAPNNDRLTLAVAQEIEKTFGGWIPPLFSENPILTVS